MADELPNWVYDIVIDLQDHQREHPKLYFTSGAFEGYRPYDWCPCSLLESVPDDVMDRAEAIGDYLRNVTSEDQSSDRPPAGDEAQPCRTAANTDEGA